MRFACLLAEGFEDIEALGTSALLRRAGFDVDFFSVFNTKKVKGAYLTVVTKLNYMRNLNVDDYDGLFIPGGKAAYVLRENVAVQKIVKEFYEERKWMLAICAAPSVFGMMGIMDGKKYISHPSIQSDMGKAIRVDTKAVSDDRFVTGRSAGAVYDFVFEIIKTINGENALEDFKKKIFF
jgi:protein deglycase